MSMGIFDFYFPEGTSTVTAGLRVSPKGWIYAAIAVLRSSPYYLLGSG